MASAQTGTGKTAGFTLPLLQRLIQNEPHAKGRRPVRALILTPTRELAAQVGENVRDYSKYLNIRSLVVFGGVSINPQMMKLRGGVDILVATPGRLLDLEHQNAVSLDKVEILVLDEADRMLDMGFIHDIRRVLAKLPARRQNLLFSATFSDEIKGLAEKLLHNPLEVEVARRNTASSRSPSTSILLTRTASVNCCRSLSAKATGSRCWCLPVPSMAPTTSRNSSTKTASAARRSMATRARGARTRALADFKSGGIRVLVATDIAARGLDIEELPHVVNYELPNVPEDYVHRIGRTGRAAATGEALSLVCVDEHKLLRDIERLLKKRSRASRLPAMSRIRPLKPNLSRTVASSAAAVVGKVRGAAARVRDAADSRAARIMPRAVRTARRRKRALRTANRRAAVARVNRLANNTLMSGPR